MTFPIRPVVHTLGLASDPAFRRMQETRAAALAARIRSTPIEGFATMHGALDRNVCIRTRLDLPEAVVNLNTTLARPLADGSIDVAAVLDAAAHALERYGRRDPRRREMRRRMALALGCARHEASAVEGFDFAQGCFAAATPWSEAASAVDGYLHREWTEGVGSTPPPRDGFLPQGWDVRLVGPVTVEISAATLDELCSKDGAPPADAMARLRLEAAIGRAGPFPAGRAAAKEAA